MSESRPREGRWPTWAVAEGPFGIRPVDVIVTALAIVLLELSVVVGGGSGAAPLNGTAYLLGAVIALPLLFRHRWPLRVLQVSFVAIMLYYSLDRRNISPAPLLGIPVYDVAVAGYLVWAIAIPSIVMAAGLIAVGLTSGESTFVLASNFLPAIVLFVLAVMLGEVVRARRALAAETARRLRLADEERAAEAARLVAEERLRIARELHDTVAHSMATIAVQAGSALHLLNPIPTNDVAASSAHRIPPAGADAGALRTSLTAIRETSKSALGEMRIVLGQLRSPDGDVGVGSVGVGSVGAGSVGAGSVRPGSGSADPTGLDRLPALRDAVSAAGTTVTVKVEGEPVQLSAAADHAAYRILQESLTNVLRHAGPGATATIFLRYEPGRLALTVTDNGTSPTAEGGVTEGNGDSAGSRGHGINGMRERAAAVGGTLTAGRKPGGGFEVMATIPTVPVEDLT
ncbi:MAG TPA: sensor histidine kinase [Streptosporangiaceae bacterium]